MNARAWFYGQSFNSGTREPIAVDEELAESCREDVAAEKKNPLEENSNEQET